MGIFKRIRRLEDAVRWLIKVEFFATKRPDETIPELVQEAVSEYRKKQVLEDNPREANDQGR